LDDLILFNRLQRSSMGAILDIQLKKISELLKDKRMVMTVSSEAQAWLAEIGYDPAYGARPLKRVLQHTVLNPLASEIIAGRLKDGDGITVGLVDGRLSFDFEAGEGSRRLQEDALKTNPSSRSLDDFDE